MVLSKNWRDTWSNGRPHGLWRSRKDFVQGSMITDSCFKRVLDSVEKNPGGRKAGGCRCDTDGVGISLFCIDSLRKVTFLLDVKPPAFVYLMTFEF